MLTLEQVLTHHKIRITPDFSYGKMQREGSQWLRAYDYGLTKVVYFGDYKTGLSERWESDTTGMSEAEVKAHKKRVKESESAKRKEAEETQIRVKLTCELEWPNKIDRGTTDYLTRKKIDKLYGCKLDVNDYGPYLLVPLRDAGGELWNWQRVYNVKLSHGDKFFLDGGRTNGLFHTLSPNPINPDDTLYIAEGFATAASIYMALEEKRTVICAFNAGNILPVVLSLREKYPRCKFVFCADDDHAVRRPDGSPWNPGLEYAYAARDKVGGEVVAPQFTDRGDHTDFNDLHCAEGLDAVRKQILEPGSGERVMTLQPKLTEKNLALALLERYGDTLVRQDKSLFEYRSTHWVELESYEIDQIKNKLMDLGGGLDSKRVEGIYKTLFRLVPHVPEGVNLFSPRPDATNFLDGTLFLDREPRSGVYSLHFREHEKSDFLTFVIPIKYKIDRNIKNSHFQALLDECLEGEADREGMIRALKQMGGAMLVPTFSQMFFLYGISGSRKSTIALTLKKLVDERNVSACDPARMQNFEIEGMIGKLVNLHTDIDDHIPLPRGFLKRFEDDTEVQVNRKGKTVVKARLSKVHVYCANELPPNFEGQGKAFHRRVTLLKFNRDLTNTQMDKVIKNFQDIIWAEGYEGLLNFCLEGLQDLVNGGGKFFQPMSSVEGVAEWQAKSDPVTQFIESVNNEEIADKNAQILLGETRRIKPAILWLVFCEWHKIVYQFPPRLSRFKFYDALKVRGFTRGPIKGHEYFKGIGVEEAPHSVL